MARRRTTHIVRTTYYGPSDFNGSRIKVEDLMTGKSKTFSFNHGARNPHEDAALKFTGAEGVTYKRDTSSGRGNVYHTWTTKPR